MTIFGNLLFAFDIESLIRYGGLLALWLLIYASSGLLFCFFIPSGAVLFTAGVFVATGDLHYGFSTVCSLLIIASIFGNLTGYWFGLQAGPSLYKRKDARFFKRKYLQVTEEFFTNNGGKTLMVAFFVPVVRTFAPIVAGMIGMKFRRFIISTFVGSVISILIFVTTGYLIGSWPFLKPWLTYIVVGFLLLVTLPLIIKVIKGVRKPSRKNMQEHNSEANRNFKA